MFAVVSSFTSAEEEHNPRQVGFEAHSTVGVFIGDTSEKRRDGLTLGLEYERRISERLGIGFTAEHISGEFHTNVIAIPVAIHRDRWKFYAGPGVEFANKAEEPLLRLGAEYGFHVGGLEVSPQIDIDFVDGERIFVFGVVLATEI